MTNKSEKPSPEAKALSLYLMAFKSTSPKHKEKSKRVNRLWGLVQKDELELSDYLIEVQNIIKSFGGYETVVEQTVKYYIDKSGEWKLQGEDKYSVDAKAVADKLLNK
ncbi:hypothetical protein [Portibacter lacus]|uniref:Uncharacterized protein n=1 Tax=Portibacter lacus TaxID=1099794 RepID=A0AA37SUB6_9BACT|nr:hypothetical protein [Portibacter lacus]GLR19809.1 hypothetical protein GCM10007940_44250 [Portibacter lacus]